MDRISAYSFSLKQRLAHAGPERLISDLLNPLVVPTIVIGIVGWLCGFTASKLSWITGIAFLLYTALPTAGSFYLLKRNKIVSLDLPARQSRNRLFGLTIASSAIAAVGFGYLPGYLDSIIFLLSLIFLINIFAGFLINLFWKISIHTAALASAGAIFGYLSQFNLLPSSTHILSLTILLLLLPIMIWARYRLKVHTLAEVFGGAITGFLLTLVELSLLTAIWKQNL